MVTSLGRSVTKIDASIESQSPICEGSLIQGEPTTAPCQGEPYQLISEGHPVAGLGSFLRLLLEKDLQR